MKTYDIADHDGRVFAFEIANSFIGRRGTERVLTGIPNVRMLRRYKLFSGQDRFCEFELDGIRFAVDEPWGDSSRYWIGPIDPVPTEQILRVRDAFVTHTGVHPALRAALVAAFVVLLLALAMGK